MQMNREVCEKKIRIRKVLSMIVLAITLVLCFAVFTYGKAPVSARAATSGSIVDYNATVDVTVNLDVNGATSTTPESTAEVFNAHNTTNQGGYKQRNIYVNQLYPNRGNEMTGYTLRVGGSRNIYHYNTDYFTLATSDPTSDGSVEYYQSLIFTAKKSTEALSEAAWPRIALVLSNGINEITLTVRVRITAKFSPSPYDSTSDRTYFVGRQLNSTSDGLLASNANGYKDFPVRLTNYETVEINLEECLKGRKLYAADTSNQSYKAPKDRNFADQTEEQANRVLFDGDSNKYLSLNDITGFHIDSIPSIGTLVSSSNIRYYNDGNARRSFTISMNITSDDLLNPGNFDENNKLWEGDGAYFELTIVLAQNNGSDKYTVKIPVVFVPASTPKRNAEFRMDTSLNAGSTLSYPTDATTSSVGFKTVRVTPEYLCDFVSYDTNKMYFIESAPTPDTSGVVEVIAAKEGDNVYYEVTGLSNGSTDVVFNVNYRSDNSAHVLEIPVTFTVYGSYSVTFETRGTKEHKYSINSTLFEALKNDGYQIVGARMLKLQETDETYVEFGYSNGTITLTPKKDLAYTDVIGIRVELVDMEGHRVELDCGVSVNLKANDPFGTWLTWQKVLFWIGIGLGVALLILLVVWLFIRSAHRHKIDELETSAPTSAYIIKLNSTIAAAQAQQKAAAAPAYPNSQQMMLAGTPNQAPVPPNPAAMPPMPNALPNSMSNTEPGADLAGALPLGVTPQMSTPAYSAGGYPSTGEWSTGVTPSTGATSSMGVTTSMTEEIYIPLSDEELLQRIYEEKFEPRGMLKRTFDKSKDLQRRELEKEKARIRDDVRAGMSIEEACKSTKQRELDAAGMVTGDRTVDTQPVMQLDPLIVLLGFDPADPIVADVKAEEPQEDWTDDIKKLKAAEYNNQRLHAELSIIESRLDAIDSANTKTESDVENTHGVVDNLTAEMRKVEQELDDKNMALATERRKSAKEALTKEVADLETRIKANKDAITARRGDLETYTGLLARLKEIGEDYAGKKEVTQALVASSDQELADAQAEAQRIADLAAKAKRQAELNAKLEILNPMMLTVNTLDDEIKELTHSIEHSSKEKDSLKTKVTALQTEMLSTTDPAKITELNVSIKDYNKEISDLDRAATANTSLKSNKGIEMASVRRKANEFIEKEEIEVDDIIKAEDQIIGQLALEKLRLQTEAEKTKAEEAVAHWQAECDSLVNNLDNMVMEAAAVVAARVQESEEALANAQAKFAETEAAIEACDNDDERLNLTMEQMSLQEEITTLTETVETMRAEGIKTNLECRQHGEEEIENAREELARATEDFERATNRYNDVSTNINPLDLIASGSGVISQDRKKIEAENLKKLLKESQNAAEQAKLQAQMAQEEAERAVADARRASDESKAEAERIAQEAMEKAEAAREEAEQRAKEEAERARQEAEEVKRLAQEEVENARRLAEEEAERARQEAEEEAERMRLEMEEHKRLAKEEAERARQEAEEEAERMRLEMEEHKRLAEEEAERARKEAEEEAERARKEAEEEAERARKEAEEETERVRKEAEEEAERARKEAEEEAKRKAEEEAEEEKRRAEAEEEEAKRKARIEEKVAKRKEEIAKLRDELKNIAEEEQGTALREKFYQMQLGLDEDEKTSQELNDLLNKSMDDASHAAELSRYKKLANQKPRRIVKKVTERVNRVPKKKGAAGRSKARRPSSARPGARSGSGARRPSSARPGAQSSSGARRPSSARPGTRRPTGSRPTKK